MKLSRVWLLRILSALGLIIIGYSVVRHVTGFSLGEEIEGFLMNVIIFAALGIFVYNRRLTAKEKAERTENDPGTKNL
ncbi:MAG: hypothetical protein LBF74_00540 [Treponema sp.]|jgi:hypothetical protein|nr:hypothetical protein [Treponema sp.]